MSLNLIMSVHTELFICKLCGYVSHGKERPTKCPACGAPSTAFAPYQMMAEAKQLKILDFDLHQISSAFWRWNYIAYVFGLCDLLDLAVY